MHAFLRNLVNAYQQYGPIFRIPPPNGELTVMAGPKANLFLAQSGYRYFSSRKFFGDFAAELGAKNFIVAMDGPAHRQMRQFMKPAFTPDAIAGYLPLMAQTVWETLGQWRRGQQVEMVGVFRQLIASQTALAMTGHSVGDEFEHLASFLHTLLAVRVSRTAPISDLATPDFVSAKARSLALTRQIVVEHRQRGPRAEPDFVDMMLAATDQDGKPLEENDLVAATLVPFIAGLDTVAVACANMLYVLMNRPDLLKRVASEVESAFANGIPTLDELNAQKLLQATVMETLRLYPVAPAAVRHVIETFEFEGHVVKSGQKVLVAIPVTNFLPELFPEPYRFDPERFLHPRNEHRRAGAFIPFSKGPHMCLGAGLSEAQMMLTVGALLFHTRLELESPAAGREHGPESILNYEGQYHLRVLEIRG